MMSRTVKGKRVWLILAAALMVLPLLAACAPSVPAAKEKVVEVGYISPFTGAGAAQEQISLSAVLDYIRYFNEENGIPGVTVEVLWGDSASSLDRFVSIYERFKAGRIPVMISNDTFGIVPRQSTFERDKIPLVSANPVKEIVYPPHWYYFFRPSWAEQFAAVADHVMENWQGETPPKLALIGVDSTFGRQPIPEATDYARSLGIEMLPAEFVPYVVLDASGQLLRLSDQEADFVYISGLIVTSGPILRDAERLGLLDRMQFCGLEASAGKRLIEMAGAASDGYFFPKTLPAIDETEVPGIKLMQDVQTKYHGKVLMEEEYVVGWAEIAVTCEAIRRAVAAEGYENVNGPAIKEAFDSIRGFDVYGLVNISYTPEDHRGSTKAALYQVRDGEIVRATDWRDAPMLVPQG
jgi:ABC-type branched-subunit amino acid transport system substrate-binding protein